jgi:hypothetical protein
MNTKFFFAPLALLILNQFPAVAAGCSVRALDKPPSWISTVALNSQDILISDPMSGKLHFYNTSAHVTRVVPVSGSSAVTKISGGFLIQGQGQGVVLGSGGQLSSSANFSRSKADDVGLGSLYSNWVTRGETFLGYGSVSKSYNLADSSLARGFSLGFIKGHVSADRGFSDIELVETTDENSLYLFGLPYFASNDVGLYFVRMVGKRASIQYVREGAKPEEVSAFPEAFREVPQIKTPSRGVTTTAARFAEIEKQKMVAGLFGQGNLLYVLTRQPARTGEGTDWWLFQIDPRESKPLGVVRLPTKASHLSVVPGSAAWYLIERGSVRGWGDQDNKTVVEIPDKWITEPDASPLSLRNLRVTQCPAR